MCKLRYTERDVNQALLLSTPAVWSGLLLHSCSVDDASPMQYLFLLLRSILISLPTEQ